MFPSPRLLWRFLLYTTAALGTMLAIASLTPITYWWARALAHPADYRGGDVLIVLAGDVLDDNMIGQTSYWRCMYAVLTWKQGNFRKLILSGDLRTTGPMRNFLVCQGIPAEAIEIESRSLNTHENAVQTAALVRGNSGQYVLLTSDYHMFRAWRAFRKAGLETTGTPFPDAIKRGNALRARWGVFWELTAETGSVLYYQWKGWI
jgi:uncharacterized SAM-binding protein YcdF (DUF218 family)